ncbi:MAG: hypothetical protein KC656_03195, partial [Myxococcales bacterium]|nr:hypothetical protein [Myxococcales bacterium]
MLLAGLASLASATEPTDPWTATCVERGRRPWGRLLEVTGGPARNVRVHRPLHLERLQRAVRASRAPEPGMT